MLARIRPDRVAGTLSLVAAALVGAIWYIYLFVAPLYPQSLLASAVHTLSYTFSAQNEDRWWFASLAALGVTSAAVGVAYFLNVAHKRSGALLLMSLSVALGVGALAFTDWSLAFFLALPAVWGYGACMAPNRSLNRTARRRRWRALRSRPVSLVR